MIEIMIKNEINFVSGSLCRCWCGIGHPGWERSIDRLSPTTELGNVDNNDDCVKHCETLHRYMHRCDPLPIFNPNPNPQCNQQ